MPHFSPMNWIFGFMLMFFLVLLFMSHMWWIQIYMFPKIKISNFFQYKVIKWWSDGW